MKPVSIIANPASGKDIRRLVAHGSVFDNQEKVRIVRRLLLGMERSGVEEVLYMPDAFGIVERAIDGISTSIKAKPFSIYMHNTQEDTVNAARLAAEAGSACTIVLGGDGTCRAACLGSLDVPLLPLSTGTNNVFPQMQEATVAGLAAGLLATERLSPADCCLDEHYLEIFIDGVLKDLALVDIAVSSGLY
ncbi:MAG: NAD(+)/NADH kinase, partial [Desulfovibrio sp.]|nr:NAD(+)/NADH kinase [Desulfovibrio sp.]